MAAVGTDMKKSPSAAHLISWARGARLRTLRGSRWKLTLDGSGGHTLHDLRDAPHETRNRIGLAAEASRVRAMAARLRSWQAQTGDTAVLPGP